MMHTAVPVQLKPKFCKCNLTLHDDDDDNYL